MSWLDLGSYFTTSLQIPTLTATACVSTATPTVRSQPAEPGTPGEVLPAVPPPIATYQITIVQPPAPDYSVSHFDSLSAAVNSILTDNIKVIAFGEIHKNNNSTLVSTLQHFAPEVIPLLSSDHITDLILEALPYNSRAEHEANRGRFGAFLRDWFAYHPDYCGVLGTVTQAGAAHISLHGVHFQDLAEQYSRLNDLSKIINERTLSAALNLLDQGRRIALYNGLDHNNINCLNGNEQVCFGRTLHDKLGADYLEVDLLLPELAQNVDARNIAFPEWAENIPDQGVNLVKQESGRIIIIFPRSATPVQSQFPEQAPACH